MSPERPALVLSDVHYDFGHGPVLRGIELSIAAGELVALVGPNGAGKTTLLRLADGLLPLDRGGRGAISLGDRSITALDRRSLARRVAYVPQSFTVEFPFSVRELVAMGRTPYRGRFSLESATDRAAIARALDETGLALLADRPVTELSGGERQRVAVARAFAQQCPLLVLDEPTASLDLRHAYDLLERLRSKVMSGSAVLVSLHDLNLAARFADRVAVLDRGAVDATGSPIETLTAERVGRIFGVTVEVLRTTDGTPQIAAVGQAPGRGDRAKVENTELTPAVSVIH